jgi:etoposide-induced 2.4 mRNA
MVQPAFKLSSIRLLFLDQREFYFREGETAWIYLTLLQATWSPAISKRAQSLLHPTYRHQPSPASTPSSSSATSSFPSSSNPFSWVTASITRLLLIGDFQVVSRLIHLTPVFGPVLSMLYMSVIDAYYFFE